MTNEDWSVIYVGCIWLVAAGCVLLFVAAATRDRRVR